MTCHILPQLVKEFPTTTAIIHDGCEFRTSKKLLGMGMACCSQCGSIFSTFPIANFCSHCNEYVLILTEGISPKPVIQRVLAPAEYIRPEISRYPSSNRTCRDCNKKVKYSIRCKRHSREFNNAQRTKRGQSVW